MSLATIRSGRDMSEILGTHPVLQVQNVSKCFVTRHGIFSRRTTAVHAVDNVSLNIDRGRTLSIVGQSGSGKSTLGRCIMGFCDIDQGDISINGRSISNVPRNSRLELRKSVQMVFQDGFSSLNPKMTVRQILLEPIRNFRIVEGATQEKLLLNELLDSVKLPRVSLDRLPYEFSGGQRQRIGIARALATSPDLLVCDESVSALDVSVKVQIINLLRELQQERGLSLLFITHDLAIVEYVSEEVAVMYLGKIVEQGSVQRVLLTPEHPYTQSLLAAIPGGPSFHL